MEFTIDNTTLVLLGILAVLAIYVRFFSVSAPLVHPLLLGKQSDVSAVRRKGESGIYRSFATGQGSPLAVRPAGSLQTVRDVVQLPKPTEKVSQRSILNVPLTDEAFAEITRLLPVGLRALFPTLTETTSTVTLLPPSTSTAFPLLLLQLAAPSPLVVLPSPGHLSEALSSDKHLPPGLVVVHADLLEDAVEQVWEDRQGSTSVLVVGDPGKLKAGVIRSAASRGLVVKHWEDLWEAAESAPETEYPEPKYSDVHSYFYSINAAGDTRVNKVTHMNVTAGIAGLLSIFPADKRPSSSQKDVVASSISLNTPFGMAVALASIWSGSGFRFIGPTEPAWPDSPNDHDFAAELRDAAHASETEAQPTILFMAREHHQVLINGLLEGYKRTMFSNFASIHKLAGLEDGDVSRTGWWEKFVWSKIRNGVLDGIAEHLRAVIIIGDAPVDRTLALSHLLLSMPISRIRSSPYSAGPIFASHFYDLQCKLPPTFQPLSLQGKQAHVGPPTNNVEVILKGSAIDQQYQTNQSLTGRVFIKGPATLEPIGMLLRDRWVDIEEDAAALTNGTFVFDTIEQEI